MILYIIQDTNNSLIKIAIGLNDDFTCAYLWDDTVHFTSEPNSDVFNSISG